MINRLLAEQYEWGIKGTPMLLPLLSSYSESHFLYSALIHIGEDEVVVQRFALFHRLFDVCHLALGKYVLEEEAGMRAGHKAYLIGNG